ncbi:MAG: TrkA C-terminal domain-containing protein [Christensenella sp.]|nr:TrkA C-terminal domain-containing protein [Christensenella sp.]
MNLIIFIILFVLIWLLIEILSIVLKLTGLELNKARFQVISILTHTGFTTRESELIVQHPTRRRIASALMIISYVAQITLITLLFNVLTQASQNILGTAIALSIMMLFVIVVTQSKYLSERFDKVTEKLLKNKIKKMNSNGRIEQVLNLSPEFSIYELIVDTESFICDKTLQELQMKEHYIQILKIDRGSEMIDFPRADTKVLAGDRMIVYGKIDALTQLIMKQ